MKNINYYGQQLHIPKESCSRRLQGCEGTAMAMVKLGMMLLKAEATVGEV